MHSAVTSKAQPALTPRPETTMLPLRAMPTTLSTTSAPPRGARTWARRGSVAAAVTALSLAGASGVDAAPDPMTAEVLAESGERAATGAGPVVAPVDPAHASHAAATAALAHAHAASRPVDGPAEAAAPVDGQVSAASVTALAATDPAVVGQWSTSAYDLPLRAVHVTALKDGTVLLIAGPGNKAGDNRLRNFKAYVWDPTSGVLTAKPVPYDAFCSFHLVDADGNVIVVGGTESYTTTTTTAAGTTTTP